jgi:hypothetical protein
MTIRSEFTDGSAGLLEIDAGQSGGNVGFGLMAFADRWSFRSDVRYFAGFGDKVQVGDEPSDALDPADFLSDVSFWRANVGIAYRW